MGLVCGCAMLGGSWQGVTRDRNKVVVGRGQGVRGGKSEWVEPLQRGESGAYEDEDKSYTLLTEPDARASFAFRCPMATSM